CARLGGSSYRAMDYW
nr:immunoglobulin heavy chain junction region [Mus musculus]